MGPSTRGLGIRLIAVTAAIITAAALIVGVVVTKLSEDAVKDRLARQVAEVASLVVEMAGVAPETRQLDRAVLGVRLRQGGSAWVIDAAGHAVATPERLGGGASRDFSHLEIELIAAQQTLSSPDTRAAGSRVALPSVIGRFDGGIGIVHTADGAPRLVAFQVLRDRGWLVAVDEPAAASTSAAAGLKRYILLTCVALGVAILLSTGLSISGIIKPFYRERLELSEKIEAANKNLKKLHEVSVGMQRSVTLDERIPKILGAAHEVLGLDRIFLYLPNAEHTVLQCRGAIGNQDEPAEVIVLPLGPEGGVIAQAFLQRRTYRVENSRDLPRDLRLNPPLDEIRALRSLSFVVIPMIVENECVGVVAVDNQRTKAPIGDEAIEGLELFTSQAAVAIENARLYQQLKVYADELEVTDHLTHLFTFFHLKKLLQGEVERARLDGTPLALAVVRIENFAAYNELLGHKHGDEVLRKVAEGVRKAARKRDVIGRCFGSTFAMILPQTQRDDARSIARELVSDLAEATYPGEDAVPGGCLRFAVGCEAYARGEGWTAEDFFSAVNGGTQVGEA